jgi:DNA-binding CsgD family transcriptional regulator/tetratricopeptide (TPR) repeat protein
VVIGRGPELGRIRALLDAARAGRSDAMLLEGAAGFGKSTLLAAAADLAGEGTTVLRARGVESEAGLDHAALLELLGPLRDLQADLPARPAAALAAALGWGDADAAGDRFLVGAGTLMLLARAAERGPVLVLVDDLQWVDRESAQALLFAARRLSADAVALLFAARADVPLPVAADGVERLMVGGLSAAEAEELLDGVTKNVVDRLRAATGGNPLAMLETVARLNPAQRVGAGPLPEPLPVGDRLERDYARLLAGLTPAAWRSVLLLAASHDEAEAPVVDALAAAGLDAEAALDEAQAHGVIDMSGGRVTFRHPLLRSAAWSVATAAQRRDAHRALAGALPAGPERALQAAAATAGRNDALAEELAALAASMRARSGLAAASAAFERAAALSKDSDRAAGWLAEAVDDAFLAGDTERARTLGQRALEPGPARPRVLYTLGQVEEFSGSIVRAAELQEEAAREGTGLLRARALHGIVVIRYRLDDMAGMLTAAERLAEVADEADPEQRMLAAYSLGAAEIFGGDAARGRELMLRAVDLLESEPTLRDDPRHLVTSILVARWLSDPMIALGYVPRRMDAARERGALGALAVANTLACWGLIMLGDHAGGYAMAGEAVELGEAAGYLSELAAAHLALAEEEASRGRHDEASRSIAAAHRLVATAGLADIAEFVHYSDAYCAGCRGDHQRVIAILEPLARVAGRGPSGDLLSAAPELVEAYLAVGRAEDAANLARRYAEANPPPLSPIAAGLVARTRALVEPDLDAAGALFEAARESFGPGVLDAGRTRLLHGSRLRRAGQRIAAREQLRAAREAFAAADLTLWVNRMSEELAATGETARSRRPHADEPLTSQETRVALLVARGMTNKEVAAALFLSPKTVEHHLGSVFRKRALRSRTELARAFAAGG